MKPKVSLATSILARAEKYRAGLLFPVTPTFELPPLAAVPPAAPPQVEQPEAPAPEGDAAARAALSGQGSLLDGLIQ